MIGMAIPELTFFFLLPIVAFLYASVGHGGASGYLALMALFSFAPEQMRPTALVLNVFVSLVAFIQYYRSGYFDWRLFWPFALASVPAAFLGGMIVMDGEIYKRVLGVLLLFSVIRLVGFGKIQIQQIKPANLISALCIGGVIGLLSGLIGIGGGIILSPVILLLHWGDMKRTAAVSALFIFVNSLAGLAGLWTKGFEMTPQMLLMLGLAGSGGILGAWLGAGKMEQKQLTWILALVLTIASMKLLMT